MKIPCRKCSCGLYNDISISVCSCGKQLLPRAPYELIDCDALAPEQCGSIDRELKFYVQKCSACSALNVTLDITQPVAICFNCGKGRVKSVKPVLYEEEPEKAEPAESGPSQAADTPVTPAEDAAADSRQWNDILGNIAETAGHSQPAAETANDGDQPGWDDILGTTPRSPSITLTAIRYGKLSFTLEAVENKPYLMGRSANQSEFLSQDLRVSNEHCTLLFRSGQWYVQDNHSSNGTIVSGYILPINGESPLHHGNELVLGHEADSMAFRISIE